MTLTRKIADPNDPTRDIEVELTPEEEAAQLAEWAAAAPTFEDRKGEVRALIDAKTQEVFSGGFTVPSGSLQGHNLQCRNETDRTNWLTSLSMYQVAMSLGQGDVVDAVFRTTANETITITYAEGFEAILGIAQWGRAVYARAWTLKDAVAAAEDGLALANVKTAIQFGWP
jgi:hypothetical protein